MWKKCQRLRHGDTAEDKRIEKEKEHNNILFISLSGRDCTESKHKANVYSVGLEITLLW